MSEWRDTVLVVRKRSAEHPAGRYPDLEVIRQDAAMPVFQVYGSAGHHTPYLHPLAGQRPGCLSVAGSMARAGGRAGRGEVRSGLAGVAHRTIAALVPNSVVVIG